MPGALLIARPARIHTGALAQIAFAVIPSAVLLGSGQLGQSAWWLFGSLVAFTIYHLLNRNYLTIIVLAVGSIPATMLLRGAFYYSSLIALLAAGPLCLLLTGGRDATRFMRDRPLVAFFAAGVFYWWGGYMLSGDYSKTMRILELGLSAGSVCLLGAHRSRLATAFTGLGLSTAAVAGALAPYGGARLGIAVIDNMYIGNPITLGLSSAAVLLLSIADRGCWLMLDRHPVRRSAAMMLAAISLLLSTSRGSWLVTAIGMSVIVVFGRRDRPQLLFSLAVLTAAVALVLQTDRGADVRSYFEKAVSDENSLAKRTTGRADQWQNFPRVFDASPLWGFGPGSGKEVSLRYTKEGKPWHSLYLLLGTETGLVGLTALGLLLAVLTLRSFAHWQRWGEIGPLVGICCFMWIGVSVSGLDAISGIFLGLGFLSGRTAPTLVIRNGSSIQPALLPGAARLAGFEARSVADALFG